MLSFISLPSICLAILALAPDIDALPHWQGQDQDQAKYERVAREIKFVQIDNRQLNAAITAPTTSDGIAASLDSAVPTSIFNQSSPTGLGSPNYGSAVSTHTTTMSLYKTNGSTVYDTFTTTVCSTTINAFSSAFTVTDCDQTLTFSTNTATLTADAVVSTHSPAIHSVVFYYSAPWHFLNSSDPTAINVIACAIDTNGNISGCQEFLEIWEVHISYVEVVSTRTVTAIKSFTAPANVTIGTQVTSIDAGNHTFSSSVYETTTTASSSISKSVEMSVEAVSHTPSKNITSSQAASTSTDRSLENSCGSQTTSTVTLHSTIFSTQAVSTIYLSASGIASASSYLSSTRVYPIISSSPVSVKIPLFSNSTIVSPSTTSTPYEPTTTITIYRTLTQTVTVTPSINATGTAHSTSFILPSSKVNGTIIFPTAQGARRRRHV